MHPILVHLGKLQIRSYGFMLALSFLLGIWLASKRARRAGVDPQKILDLSVIIILAAVVGSRLLYVMFHLDQYSNPLDMFALWQGGATFYGGFILAVIASYWWVQKHKIPFLQMADIMAPSIALGLIFTRIGCFLSGCCYGKPTTHSWGVVFPPDSPAGAAAMQLAQQQGIPLVGVTETLQPVGATFQVWQVAQLTALEAALASPA